MPEHAVRDFRWLMIVFGSLLAMCLPAVGIVVWDLRKERVNSTHDVAKRLKIPVIGAVPMIPATVMRRLGDSTRKSQLWKLRFTESVDGVAARLLRKAECDQVRVVLITSAVSGEGKTTLATQLAMSMARAQRKTVLVDFDLRQPTLDGALGLPWDRVSARPSVAKGTSWAWSARRKPRALPWSQPARGIARCCRRSATAWWARSWSSSA